jgi:hypothetical protein
MKVLRHLAKGSNTMFGRPCLRIADPLTADVPFHILREIFRMGRRQVLVQWDGILDEFDYSYGRGKRDYLICSDAKISLSSSSMVFQEIADLLENLLHYRILP